MNKAVKVTFDKDKVAAKIRARVDRALAPTSNQILKDCNFYCREDSGELIRSSIRASEPDKGLLVWDTDYASKVYYTGKPAPDTNPNASLRWGEKAKAAKKKAWEARYQSEYEKGG